MSRPRALLLLLLCLFAPLDVLARAPEPVKAVDLERYAGRWFEIARTPNRHQRHCLNATADYERTGESLRVVQTRRDASGEPNRTIRANARILDPGENAKIRLTFLGFLSQEYWVIDRAEDYGWALVGDPSGRYLWVLARTSSLPATTLDAILARAERLGYDPDRLVYARSLGADDMG